MKDDYTPVYGKGASLEVQKMQDTWNYSELEELFLSGEQLTERQLIIYRYLVKKLNVKDPVIDMDGGQE